MSIPATYQKLKRLVLLAILACESLGAQSSPPALLTTTQGAVPIPVSSGVLGRRDTKAMQELNDHISVVGSASLTAVEYKGILRYTSGSMAEYPATFYNKGSNNFRLDINTNPLPISIRIHNNIGKSQDGSNQLKILPIDISLAGIFPFVIPRQIRQGDARTSVIDKGNVLIGGEALHRISIERMSAGTNPLTHLPETLTTD